MNPWSCTVGSTPAEPFCLGMSQSIMGSPTTLLYGNPPRYPVDSGYLGGGVVGESTLHPEP